MNTKHILSVLFSTCFFWVAVAENGTTDSVAANNTISTADAITGNTDIAKLAHGGDGYDDEFQFSRRIRRFHNHQNGGQQRWSYYDPYYSSDVYYMVNTPGWNSYYYGNFYAPQMTTVVVRPTFWGVMAALLFAPTYYNYGYYNPSPYGWGYYGGMGYYSGWNQCYWGGGNYGYGWGYYGGYNHGFNNGYANGYYNGYANGYNQGYYDGYNNGFYNGGGQNGDDWWYWKNQNPSNSTPRPSLTSTQSGNSGKGGTNTAIIPTGGRNEVGMNQTSIVKPSKGEIGVQTGNLGNRPVTSPANSGINNGKPSTEPVKQNPVKWDAQTGDEPIRTQTQPSKPTWSSEPSRPTTTSSRPQQNTGSVPSNTNKPTWTAEPSTPSMTRPRPQENMGSTPPVPARPQTQVYGNRPGNVPSGFQNESRPKPSFDNRPNKTNYDNQQNSQYNSGYNSNPTTPGRTNGDRPNYNASRTPQNGYNSSPQQNQPSMSKPQPQAAPATAPRPNSSSKANQGSVKLPAPTGKRGGLSYQANYSIVP